MLYGALVLGGGLAGEQGAKALLDGIMGMFGKGKGEENINQQNRQLVKIYKERRGINYRFNTSCFKISSRKEDLITPVKTIVI